MLIKRWDTVITLPNLSYKRFSLNLSDKMIIKMKIRLLKSEKQWKIVRLNQINIVETKENLNLRRKKKDYTFVNRKIRFNLLYYY